MNLRNIQEESESEAFASQRTANVEADPPKMKADVAFEAGTDPTIKHKAGPSKAYDVEQTATLPWTMTTDFQDILRIKPKFDTRKRAVVMLGCSAAVIMIIFGTRHRTVQPKPAVSTQKLPDTVKAQPPPFSYLVPKKNGDWVSHEGEVLYDSKLGVAKYNVDYTADKATIVITQQQFPDKLKPRTSSAFQQFIVDLRPSQTMQLGPATLYFIASPGQPSSGGKAAIIYATDPILLFARSNVAIDAAHWAKLMGSLQEIPGGR